MEQNSEKIINQCIRIEKHNFEQKMFELEISSF